MFLGAGGAIGFVMSPLGDTNSESLPSEPASGATVDAGAYSGASVTSAGASVSAVSEDTRTGAGVAAAKNQ